MSYSIETGVRSQTYPNAKKNLHLMVLVTRRLRLELHIRPHYLTSHLISKVYQREGY